MRGLSAAIVAALHVLGTASAKPTGFLNHVKNFFGVDDNDAVVGDAVDDGTCVYEWKTLRCKPERACSLQYEFGDTTPSQACRLNKESSVRNVPQQFHLAFAGEEAGTGMTVSWTTFALDTQPMVWLGRNATSLEEMKTAPIDVKNYYRDDDYELYNYHATLTDLEPNTVYYYKVGNAEEKQFQSSINSFKTARASGDSSAFTVAVYGDLGAHDNSAATNKYVNSFDDSVDFIYHIGDISYADNAFLTVDKAFGFYYEEVYNRFMNSMTLVMRRLAYMVLVGNHESECHSGSCLVSKHKRQKLGNYSAFNARFRMPSPESGGVLNMWYSYEYASAHFTSISTETDYPNAPGNNYATEHPYGGFGNQLAWLEADLKAAHANRNNVPWLIVGMHRPIYTTRSCDANGNPNDDYEARVVQQAFEDLFIKYEVDLVFQAHVHAYERTYPIAKGKAIKDGVSTDKTIYDNPQAPVYVISGSAGGPEGIFQYKNPQSPEWLVIRDNKRYSISKLIVTPTNVTVTTIESATGEVYDQFSIIKTAQEQEQVA
ncbi:hypothetical protein PsorP6_011446 [Peronosclerospora sorghi]|uniref:Uncharacterized protein n=1 Tax=Peronosclerospora sorghi TaxID=230839 RepID=A0ACC0WKL3_9STRA|nr:hypothetical protein PsorP6_011446 [Peronosclerospora sorghi]